jgi:long-chain acyl-CoA synthetase
VDQAALFGAGRKVLMAVCTSAPGSLQGAAWEALQAAITEAVGRLPPAERPAGVLVLDRPFSMADGELTPNLKLRRAAIEQHLAGELDRLCAAVDRAGAAPGAGPLVLAGPATAQPPATAD